MNGNQSDDSEDLVVGVVPDIAPPPMVVREFVAAPWHRPRKHFIRMRQWNHEITSLVIPELKDGENLLRILGLPSTDFLDLLSMQQMCEEHSLQILYLGYNHSPEGLTPGSPPAVIDVYDALNSQRKLDNSSFVHQSSKLVPDRFESIVAKKSMARASLREVGQFDVINLDLCGCIVKGDIDRSRTAIAAIDELLRTQAENRLKPWLLFVTTFASHSEIDLDACAELIEAIELNAAELTDFSEALTSAGVDLPEIKKIFSDVGEAEAADPLKFISIFSTAFGKWVAKQTKSTVPPAVVSMLPSYCFRHDGKPEPQLISLAYVINPMPDGGRTNPTSGERTASHAERYRSNAMRIVRRSFAITDLDALLNNDQPLNLQMVAETEALLIGSGLEAEGVKRFLSDFV